MTHSQELLWALLALVVNMLVGVCVWAALDRRNRRFYNWHDECSVVVGIFFWPVMLTAWPLAIWLWWALGKGVKGYDYD